MDKIVHILESNILKVAVIVFVAAGIWYDLKHEIALLRYDLSAHKEAVSEKEIDDLKICCAANRIEIRTMGK